MESLNEIEIGTERNDSPAIAAFNWSSADELTIKSEVSPIQFGLEEKLPSEKLSVIWAWVTATTKQKNSKKTFRITLIINLGQN